MQFLLQSFAVKRNSWELEEWGGIHFNMHIVVFISLSPRYRPQSHCVVDDNFNTKFAGGPAL